MSKIIIPFEYDPIAQEAARRQEELDAKAYAVYESNHAVKKLADKNWWHLMMGGRPSADCIRNAILTVKETAQNHHESRNNHAGNRTAQPGDERTHIPR